MSYDPYRPQATVAATGSDVDAGLQGFMRSVYNTMGLGLGVTGITAFGFAQMMLGNEQLRQAVMGSFLGLALAFAPLGFIFFGFTGSRIQRMSAASLRTLFFVFSGVMGLSMASIFLIYSAESIARVFFISAGMFAAPSLYGYTTKRDLARMGSFMFMGMIGLLIAGVVNMFLQSSMLHFVTSGVGVIVFTGMAAWDTQRLKETYAHGAHLAEANSKLAVMGALNMYINFVAL